jgi:hypothetical protein
VNSFTTTLISFISRRGSGCQSQTCPNTLFRRGGKPLCRGRTAGPSTTLRFGRDDNSVRGQDGHNGAVVDLATELSSRRLTGLGPTQGNEKRLLFSNYSPWKRHLSPCHPDRSAAQWRDLRFATILPYSLYRPASTMAAEISRPNAIVFTGSCFDNRRKMVICVRSISPSATAARTRSAELSITRKECAA